VEGPREDDMVAEARIVYLGPNGAGTSTNLEVLRGRLAPVDERPVRPLDTTPFDVLGLELRGPSGVRIKLEVVSVAGDDELAPARAAAVERADVLVVVADSDPERQSDQVRWLEGLERLVRERCPGEKALPVVVQCNKADLPTAVPTLAVARSLGFDGLAAVPAAARFGEGVLETLEIALQRWIELRSLEGALPWFASGDQAQAWVRRLLQTTPDVVADRFGPIVGRSPSFGRPGIGHGAVADSRTLVQKEDGPANWYAEASAELVLSLVDAHRTIRDVSNRLSELARATSIAAEMPSGRIGGDLRRMLSFLREAAPASRASFILWGESAPLGSVPLPPLDADPLLDRMGARYLAKVAEARRPFFSEIAEDSELAALLDGEPWVALAALPVSAVGRLLGLAVIYLDATNPLPTGAELSHLGLLASAFGPALGLASRPEGGPWPHPERG
jgi:signal recognition particle receptor subunit beta